VRNENRGEAVRTVQIFQQLENHLTGTKIQVPGGFVGQQHGRLAYKGTSQHDALLFASR
jgi:hypothetical protein